MLLKSPIDNDSRVKKEIKSLKAMGFEVRLISVNGISLDGIAHYVFHWKERRMIIPGVAGLIFYIKFILFTMKNYQGEPIVHAHDLNTLPAATFLKFLNRKNRIKIIYDSHEFAANDVPYETNFSKKIKYLNEWLWIRGCNYVITVSDSIAERYAKIYNIKKPYVVLNCPNYKGLNYSNRFREIFNIQKKDRIFLYQGAFSKGRGIESLLKIFATAQNSDMVIIFMGYGELASLIKDHAKQIPNIFYHSAVPQEILMEYTASADVGVALIEDSCISYRFCLPNKLFEYTMAGLPVIVSNLPEMRKLVASFQVGVVCQSNDFNDIATVIKLVSTMDLGVFKSNLKPLNLNYNWEREALKLKAIYASFLTDVS
jgi:glycosyltransferase involved in cell wall biosynthesis